MAMLKVMVMNSNGDKNKSEADEVADLARTRNETTKYIISTEQPDLILMQDFPRKLDSITEMCNNSGDIIYESRGNKNAGLMFNTSKIEVLEEWESPTPRAHGVIMRCCKGSLNFLAISYHGSPKQPGDDRQTTLMEILEKSNEFQILNEKEKQASFPIIIGGDFNIQKRGLILPLAYQKPRAGKIQNSPYLLQSRDRGIDHLLSSEIIKVPGSSIEARNIKSIVKKLFPKFPESDLKRVFDHDPIIAHIEIPSADFTMKSEDVKGESDTTLTNKTKEKSATEEETETEEDNHSEAKEA